MAVFGHQVRETFKAAADLSAVADHFVRLSAADTVNVASEAINVANIGILSNKPAAAGRTAAVITFGRARIVAGGSVTVNVLVTCNGSGRAAAATSGQMVMGIALTGASTDGEIIDMLLNPYKAGSLV